MYWLDEAVNEHDTPISMTVKPLTDKKSLRNDKEHNVEQESYEVLAKEV